MGVMLEQFARHRFSILKKRSFGKGNTGYDHIINIGSKQIFIEQKSSGNWSNNDLDFKFQHIETKHKWDILLLCGIGYNNISFYGLKRNTFNMLIDMKKITNQGSKNGNSSEGFWFNFKNVKEFVTEIHTTKQLLQFSVSIK